MPEVLNSQPLTPEQEIEKNNNLIKYAPSADPTSPSANLTVVGAGTTGQVNPTTGNFDNGLQTYLDKLQDDKIKGLQLTNKWIQQKVVVADPQGNKTEVPAYQVFTNDNTNKYANFTVDIGNNKVAVNNFTDTNKALALQDQLRKNDPNYSIDNIPEFARQSFQKADEQYKNAYSNASLLTGIRNENGYNGIDKYTQLNSIDIGQNIATDKDGSRIIPLFNNPYLSDTSLNFDARLIAEKTNDQLITSIGKYKSSIVDYPTYGINATIEKANEDNKEDYLVNLRSINGNDKQFQNSKDIARIAMATNTGLPIYTNDASNFSKAGVLFDGQTMGEGKNDNFLGISANSVNNMKAGMLVFAEAFDNIKLSNLELAKFTGYADEETYNAQKKSFEKDLDRTKLNYYVESTRANGLFLSDKAIENSLGGNYQYNVINDNPIGRSLANIFTSAKAPLDSAGKGLEVAKRLTEDLTGVSDIDKKQLRDSYIQDYIIGTGQEETYNRKDLKSNYNNVVKTLSKTGISAEFIDDTASGVARFVPTLGVIAATGGASVVGGFASGGILRVAPQIGASALGRFGLSLVETGVAGAIESVVMSSGSLAERDNKVTDQLNFAVTQGLQNVAGVVALRGAGSVLMKGARKTAQMSQDVSVEMGALNSKIAKNASKLGSELGVDVSYTQNIDLLGRSSVNAIEDGLRFDKWMKSENPFARASRYLTGDSQNLVQTIAKTSVPIANWLGTNVAQTAGFSGERFLETTATKYFDINGKSNSKGDLLKSAQEAGQETKDALARDLAFNLVMSSTHFGKNMPAEFNLNTYRNEVYGQLSKVRSNAEYTFNIDSTNPNNKIKQFHDNISSAVNSVVEVGQEGKTQRSYDIGSDGKAKSFEFTSVSSDNVPNAIMREISKQNPDINNLSNITIKVKTPIFNDVADGVAKQTHQNLQSALNVTGGAGSVLMFEMNYKNPIIDQATGIATTTRNMFIGVSKAFDGGYLLHSERDYIMTAGDNLKVAEVKESIRDIYQKGLMVFSNKEFLNAVNKDSDSIKYGIYKKSDGKEQYVYQLKDSQDWKSVSDIPHTIVATDSNKGTAKSVRTTISIENQPERVITAKDWVKGIIGDRSNAGYIIGLTTTDAGAKQERTDMENNPMQVFVDVFQKTQAFHNLKFEATEGAKLAGIRYDSIEQYYTSKVSGEVDSIGIKLFTEGERLSKNGLDLENFNLLNEPVEQKNKNTKKPTEQAETLYQELSPELIEQTKQALQEYNDRKKSISELETSNIEKDPELGKNFKEKNSLFNILEASEYKTFEKYLDSLNLNSDGKTYTSEDFRATLVKETKGGMEKAKNELVEAVGKKVEQLELLERIKEVDDQISILKKFKSSLTDKKGDLNTFLKDVGKAEATYKEIVSQEPRLLDFITSDRLLESIIKDYIIQDKKTGGGKKEIGQIAREILSNPDKAIEFVKDIKEQAQKQLAGEQGNDLFAGIAEVKPNTPPKVIADIVEDYTKAIEKNKEFKAGEEAKQRRQDIKDFASKTKKGGTEEKILAKIDNTAENLLKITDVSKFTIGELDLRLTAVDGLIAKPDGLSPDQVSQLKILSDKLLVRAEVLQNEGIKSSLKVITETYNNLAKEINPQTNKSKKSFYDNFLNSVNFVFNILKSGNISTKEIIGFVEIGKTTKDNLEKLTTLKKDIEGNQFINKRDKAPFLEELQIKIDEHKELITAYEAFAGVDNKGKGGLIGALKEIGNQKAFQESISDTTFNIIKDFVSKNGFSREVSDMVGKSITTTEKYEIIKLAIATAKSIQLTLREQAINAKESSKSANGAIFATRGDNLKFATYFIDGTVDTRIKNLETYKDDLNEFSRVLEKEKADVENRLEEASQEAINKGRKPEESLKVYTIEGEIQAFDKRLTHLKGMEGKIDNALKTLNGDELSLGSSLGMNNDINKVVGTESKARKELNDIDKNRKENKANDTETTTEQPKPDTVAKSKTEPTDTAEPIIPRTQGDEVAKETLKPSESTVEPIVEKVVVEPETAKQPEPTTSDIPPTKTPSQVRAETKKANKAEQDAKANAETNSPTSEVKTKQPTNNSEDVFSGDNISLKPTIDTNTNTQASKPDNLSPQEAGKGGDVLFQKDPEITDTIGIKEATDRAKGIVGDGELKIVEDTNGLLAKAEATGSFDSNTQTITISNKGDRTTVPHEILHGILDIFRRTGEKGQRFADKVIKSGVEYYERQNKLKSGEGIEHFKQNKKGYEGESDKTIREEMTAFMFQDIGNIQKADGTFGVGAKVSAYASKFLEFLKSMVGMRDEFRALKSKAVLGELKNLRSDNLSNGDSTEIKYQKSQTDNRTEQDVINSARTKFGQIYKGLPDGDTLRKAEVSKILGKEVESMSGKGTYADGKPFTLEDWKKIDIDKSVSSINIPKISSLEGLRSYEASIAGLESKVGATVKSGDKRVDSTLDLTVKSIVQSILEKKLVGNTFENTKIRNLQEKTVKLIEKLNPTDKQQSEDFNTLVQGMQVNEDGSLTFGKNPFSIGIKDGVDIAKEVAKFEEGGQYSDSKITGLSVYKDGVKETFPLDNLQGFIDATGQKYLNYTAPKKMIDRYEARLKDGKIDNKVIEASKGYIEFAKESGFVLKDLGIVDDVLTNYTPLQRNKNDVANKESQKEASVQSPDAIKDARDKIGSRDKYVMEFTNEAGDGFNYNTPQGLLEALTKTNEITIKNKTTLDQLKQTYFGDTDIPLVIEAKKLKELQKGTLEERKLAMQIVESYKNEAGELIKFKSIGGDDYYAHTSVSKVIEMATRITSSSYGDVEVKGVLKKFNSLLTDLIDSSGTLKAIVEGGRGETKATYSGWSMLILNSLQAFMNHITSTFSARTVMLFNGKNPLSSLYSKNITRMVEIVNPSPDLIDSGGVNMVLNSGKRKRDKLDNAGAYTITQMNRFFDAISDVFPFLKSESYGRLLHKMAQFTEAEMVVATMRNRGINPDTATKPQFLQIYNEVLRGGGGATDNPFYLPNITKETRAILSKYQVIVSAGMFGVGAITGAGYVPAAAQFFISYIFKTTGRIGSIGTYASELKRDWSTITPQARKDRLNVITTTFLAQVVDTIPMIGMMVISAQNLLGKNDDDTRKAGKGSVREGKNIITLPGGFRLSTSFTIDGQSYNLSELSSGPFSVLAGTLQAIESLRGDKKINPKGTDLISWLSEYVKARTNKSVLGAISLIATVLDPNQKVASKGGTNPLESLIAGIAPDIMKILNPKSDSITQKQNRTYDVNNGLKAVSEPVKQTLFQKIGEVALKGRMYDEEDLSANVAKTLQDSSKQKTRLEQQFAKGEIDQGSYNAQKAKLEKTAKDAGSSYDQLSSVGSGGDGGSRSSGGGNTGASNQTKNDIASYKLLNTTSQKVREGNAKANDSLTKIDNANKVSQAKAFAKASKSKTAKGTKPSKTGSKGVSIKTFKSSKIKPIKVSSFKSSSFKVPKIQAIKTSSYKASPVSKSSFGSFKTTPIKQLKFKKIVQGKQKLG